jgi:AcrR family transcriptional regulator
MREIGFLGSLMKSKRRPAKERLSQPERRKRTQDRLLRAAIELLIERGYSNLTLEIVSQRAGVSRGAQTNYFPTKRDLLLATMRQVVTEGMPKPLPRLPKRPAAADVLDVFIAESKRFFLSPRYTAMIELHVGGRHDPSLTDELVRVQREFRQAMDDTWLALFATAGVSRKVAKDIVEMTDNFFRGVALLACIQIVTPDKKAIAPWEATLREKLVKPRR